MCNPAQAASAGQSVVGIASDVLGFAGQRRAYKQNARSALAGYSDDIEALNARQDQVNRAASNDILNNEIAALEAKGQARASANGLADVSLGEVLQGVGAAKGRANTNIKYNRDTAAQQTQRDIRGAQAAANNRIASVARPSLTALGFKLAGDVIGGQTTYEQLKQRGS